jgi:plasmid replication initiation protein
MRHGMRAPTAPNEQLDLFRALPGDMAPRDAQDLMAHPFFSLAKSRRTVALVPSGAQMPLQATTGAAFSLP